MYFVDKATKLFPGIEWLGRSGIHVSICWDGVVPETKKKSVMVLKILSEAKMPEAIYHHLTRKFPADEWLLTVEQFRSLYLADMYRGLNDQPPIETPNKLRNPSTGNRFHRLMLRADVVGGIRFWCGDQNYHWDEEQRGLTTLGWRFRIEKQDATEEGKENTRENTRERVALAEAECVPLLVQMEAIETIEVALPVQEVQKQVRELEMA